MKFRVNVIDYVESAISDRSGGIFFILSNMKKVYAKHNYYVYFLTNKNKTVLYVGVTNDLKDRLYFHNNPESHSKSFSHKYKCKYLICYENYFNVDVVIKREKQIKRWSRRKKEWLINQKNPEWKFLNDDI